MDGEELSDKINEAYEVREKESFGSQYVPLLRRWKKSEGHPELLKNLDEVKDFLSRYFGNKLWDLVTERKTTKGTVFTFESIPHKESEAARNPGYFPTQYCHVRIRPILQSEQEVKSK